MNNIGCGSIKYVPTKVVCIGKNYAEHVKEMGGASAPSEPVIFLKPNSAIIFSPEKIIITNELGLLHHEVELCFVVGKRCRGVSAQNAAEYIAGWAVGIDFTLRAMQDKAKKAGGPWDLSKGFDSSAVFGEFMPAEKIADALMLPISLSVNGDIRQSSNTKEMIFKPADILSYTSRFMTIEEGDVFMCGTPSGVGPVEDGDMLVAEISGLPRLSFKAVRK